jgi:hypothetical protein
MTETLDQMADYDPCTMSAVEYLEARANSYDRQSRIREGRAGDCENEASRERDQAKAKSAKAAELRAAAEKLKATEQTA